jgi:hypothetical protein
MNRSRPARTPSKLSGSIHQRLNMYALAATAAGVSALALAQPAEAKIVYTSAHVHLRAGQRPFPLDLNHDGIVDFYLLHSFSHFGGEHFFAACQLPKSYHGPFCFNTNRNGNSSNVIRASVGRDFGAALRYGAKIQHGDRFITSGPERLGEVCCYNTSNFWSGPWVNGGKGVKNRYLGMKFKIKGRFHFGWARITVTTTPHDFTATLTGYAYETIPNKAIVAGKTKGPEDVEESNATQTMPTREPATLGALAMGAPGLSIWRREESTVSTRRQPL